MTIICVISARGGSRGLPNKNTKQILGKPLIAWSIEQAIAAPEISRVVVSTDSREISEIARAWGAETPFERPPALATSAAGKWEVFQHALRACETYYHEQYEAYVDLDCTNPLRDVSDISHAIKQFRDRRHCGVDGIFSVCDARKNPYFNMLELDSEGALKLSKSNPKSVVRRQDAPRVFEHVASIYVLCPSYVHNSSTLLEGHTEGYDIGLRKSLDIDSEFDFFLVESIMKNVYGTLNHKLT